MSLLSCPTCLRRAINNLTFDNPYSQVVLSSHAHHARFRIASSTLSNRHHSTYDSLVTGHHRRAFRVALNSKKVIVPNNRRKGAGSKTKSEIKDALARANNRGMLLSKDGGGDTSLSSNERRQQIRLKRDIEQYYADPLQLANVVTSKLRIPDFEAAIALVRASEGVVSKNIVSWNHCIDWCMSQGDADKAWKLYNELKKRGHRPDSHTYTIMLRGLSQNSRMAGSAQRAVGIYNSMFAPNSAVVPNTIHTNAVLNVCARAKDMESLWAIAGRLPERGSGSPDRWTFTTILNAIREDATARVAALLKDPKRTTDEGKEEGSEGWGIEQRQKVIFDEALKDGRKLWTDVSFRWRRADLVVDEQLVCAMGRLILGCGLRQDLGEVFNLIDSTMNIKLAERGHKKSAEVEGDGTTADQSSSRQENDADAYELALAEPKQAPMPLSQEQAYATPGNNTLSLILEAAIGGREMKLGKAYWHLLTTPNGPHKVAPDANNIISYLRLLRVSRASKDVLDVLSRDWPAAVAEKLYRRGTFVIAMSTCVRDKNNPGVFDTADKLLSLMQTKLEEAQVGMYDKIEASENDPSLTFKERQAAAKARVAAVDDVTFGEEEGLSELQRTKSGVEFSIVDPKALRMYVDLAVLKTPGWNEGLQGKGNADEIFERDPRKNITLRALRRLGPEMVNISRLAKLKLLEAEIAARPAPEAQKYGFSQNAQHRTNDRAGTRVAEKLDDMIDLLRSLVSAYDKVISINERFEDEQKPILDKRLVDNFRDLKRRVSGFLSRTKDEVQKITRGDMKYARWRTQRRNEDDDDNDDDNQDNMPSHRSSEFRKAEIPKIGREIQRIYDDTDRNLGRLEQRSRRQRIERRNGVQKRMTKRLGTGEDPGVLDDTLQVRRREEVEQSMRNRAFNIRVGGDHGHDHGHDIGHDIGQAEEKRLQRAQRVARASQSEAAAAAAAAV